MAFQKFSDEQQAGYILQLEVKGYPDNIHAPLEVSRQKGAPSARTLKRWWKIRKEPEIDKVVQDIKRGLSDRLYDLAQRIVDEMFVDLDTNGVDIHKAAVPLGVAIDKWQLLNDRPTERIQTEQKIINVDSDKTERAVKEAERIIGQIGRGLSDSPTA